MMFDSGVFTVEDTGIVNVDFLDDGSKYEGQLGIFSLSEMEQIDINSAAFIQEAARRVISNSELGHIVISDRTEGARFTDLLGDHEKKDWNRGQYEGKKSFDMLAGDQFGVMLVPQGTFDSLLNYPDYIGAKSPLFSMTSVDPSDGFPSGKIADLGADGQTFAMEDSYYPDYDFNDLIFRIEGATGTAISVEEVMAADRDWRMDESVQELVKEIVEPVDLAGNTPDEARKTFASTAGKVYRGYLDGMDTEDYHAFSLGMSNEFTFTLDGLRGDANVEVLDLDGNIVHSSSNSGTLAESVSGTIDAGAYRLRVFSVDGTSTAYQLNLSVTPTIEGITTTGSEERVYVQTNESLPLIGMNNFQNDARFLGIDGNGFSTVIIDSGIDLDHVAFGPDINGDGVSDQIITGLPGQIDFAADNNNLQDITNINNNGSITGSHGTHVASIAAAVAPNVNIIPLKVFLPSGDPNDPIGISANVEQALQWVVEEVVVRRNPNNIASVNLSLGRDNYGDFEEGPYNDEIEKLAANNIIVVAASGNSYFDNADQNDNGIIDSGEQFTPGVAYPAAELNTVAVGAVFDSNIGNNFGIRPIDLDGDGINDANLGGTALTTAPDQITPYSQRHATLIDIFAPGSSIRGAVDNPNINVIGPNNTTFQGKSGTSMAAPHIAGMAVLAQQLGQQELNRPIAPVEFRTWLRETGFPIFDGDDEIDNVVNTQQTYLRADMLGLANRIFEIGNPPPLPPAPTTWVTVTVNRVKGDFDPGKERRLGRGLRRGDSDFYTVLSIDNQPEWRSPTKVGSNDYIPPDWQLIRFTENPIVPITIRLYDQDKGPFNPDDHIDIDWRSGDKDLHLTYNWLTGEITGDLNGFQGEQIYASGGGDSQVGEIWFTISQIAF
ncbi:putative peptidase [Crocosphaera subtropica ATCC 51142]|uniref:Peptidase n=1 Tax=Crocosphaera subtropica (strain ATCC 51142 / BH68) TaxID=43989 RepID=B1X1Y3_CROS5|nr:S8 family serine peptidase [Crocosphaera subtropica]ACB54144.1 putative peptidase [Crocosphaera subtropica ATCC 51142]